MISLFKVNMPEGISVDEILHSGFIGQGKYVDLFEKKFAEHFQMEEENILTVDSCTSALLMSFVLTGIGDGDDVLTTPYTCLATISGVPRTGANIVWYDVDAKTGLSTLENIKKSITSTTKIVILAHLSGMIVEDLEDILDYCHSRNIKVIEDAAQSLGAKCRGRYFSDKSDYICFSFQAIKQLTTIDGGMLYCRDKKDVERGKRLRWFGFDRTLSSDFRCAQDVEELGMKVHMTDIPAYIGIESLNTIDEKIQIHINNAKIYERLFQDSNTVEVCHPVSSGSSFWVYPLLVPNRDSLKDFLSDNGIHSSIVQNRLDDKMCFSDSFKDLPNLNAFMNKIIHIPCGWWVSEDQINYIAAKVLEFCK